MGVPHQPPLSLCRVQAGGLLSSLAGGDPGREEWHDQLSYPGPHTWWDDTLWSGEEGRLLEGDPQAFLSPDRRLSILFPWPPTLEMQAVFSSICSSESCLLCFNQNSHGGKIKCYFAVALLSFPNTLLSIYEEGFAPHQIWQKMLHPPCLHVEVDKVC